MDVKLFEAVLSREGLFAILFTFLFLYFLRTSNEREKERDKELADFRDDLKQINANTTFVVSTLKIVLEKEIGRREKQ
jgi:BhlA-like holin